MINPPLPAHGRINISLRPLQWEHLPYLRLIFSASSRDRGGFKINQHQTVTKKKQLLLARLNVDVPYPELTPCAPVCRVDAPSRRRLRCRYWRKPFTLGPGGSRGLDTPDPNNHSCKLYTLDGTEDTLAARYLNSL